MKKYNVGVIVGRFQIDALHDGHMALVNQALDECDRLIIFIGTTVVRDSGKNPLDYRTRELMVSDEIPYGAEDRVSVMALGDCATDEEWSDILDKRIREVDPMGSVMLYGSRDSFLANYVGNFSSTQVEPVGDINATDRRKAIANAALGTIDFRRGVIYGKVNQYPKIHSTVDIAIIKPHDGDLNNEHDLILLGQKPGETKWRLIGGFVDPTDENLEAAARREACEETGGKYIEGKLVGGVKTYTPTYVGSFKINDWRYAREQNKIITTFFRAQYLDGDIKPSDDIAVLKWHSIRLIREGEVEINKGHTILINALMGKYYH